MATNYKDTLLSILEAIDYNEDKEAFVIEFMNIAQAQALMSLLQTMPLEKQTQAKKEFSALDTSESAKEFVKKYFSDEQVHEVFEEALKHAITNWIEDIGQTLSETQRKNLVSLSQEATVTASQ